MTLLVNTILFLCIGNSNIIGDSLGPLIGSFLQSNVRNINNDIKVDVVGTLSKPIGYQKINNLLQMKISKKRYSKVIIIDSALGEEKDIGKVIISSYKLCAGNGVNLGKDLYGDLIIKGIVGKNHNNLELNILELNRVTHKRIDTIAIKILTQINLILKSKV